MAKFGKIKNGQKTIAIYQTKNRLITGEKLDRDNL